MHPMNQGQHPRFHQRPAERLTGRPATAYPAELPITSRKDEIVAAIASHQVLIVTGDTGSGKSTQLPKMCLEAKRGLRGVIGCTEPRRIAAVTIARRIAAELGEDIGNSVAYKIRFEEKSGRYPYIKFMTDGVLLMEAQTDRLLRRYDTLIVDEAHERSLNIDFILGLLRTILPCRRDLHVIITSATMDTEKFSQAFNNAPVIHISGRLYPVELRWKPLAPTADTDEPPSHIEGAVTAVTELAAVSRHADDGDLLIFMPTEQDIRDTCELLAGRFGNEKCILPLFSRLAAADQERVFHRADRQKIVVATNVAETSLTIPNIRYVIDSGLARIAQYNPRTRTATLPVSPISQSSAEQRLGRCGRVREGVCIRLYDRDSYLDRPLFTPPEIMRANLAGVVLRMLFLNIGNVFTFPFLDPPAKRQLNDALEILRELGAISPGDKPTLTETGRLMARMPVDPRFSRMIIAGKERNCLEEVLIITAALSIVDPRERPQEKLAQAAQMHARWQDPASDFTGMLKIWQACGREAGEGSSSGRLRKFCRTNYLSWRRMREWQELYHQLQNILAEALPAASLPIPADPGADLSTADRVFPNEADNPAVVDERNASLHKAILSGFLSGIAVKKDKHLYTACKGRTAMIFPGSGVFRKGGQWIVAAEWVETSRLFARTVANVEPEWIAEAAGPLCRVTYNDPFWNRERGEVQAYAQVSLFGMVIIPRRVVSYGRIGPDIATEIFIREGIIAGNLKGDYPFLKYNEEVIQEARRMENKLRAPGMFFDEEAVGDFYRRRLPQMFSERSLRSYLRRQGGDNFLRMKTADIVRALPDPEALQPWPDETRLQGVNIPLSYKFSPGGNDDGISARVPVSLLAAPECLQIENSVPGLVRERIVALLRLLPKSYRRQLPSLPELTEVLISGFPNDQTSLSQALSRIIKNNYGIFVPREAWQVDALPEELKMCFVIADDKGQVVATSRDLPALHALYRETAMADSLGRVRSLWEANNLQPWSCGALPESLPLEDHGHVIGTAYPALQVTEGVINLRLFTSPAEAESHHRRGVVAFFEKHFASELQYLKKTILPAGPMKIHAEKFGGIKKVQTILYDKILHDLFFANIRNSETFYNYAQEVKGRILPRGQEVLTLAAPVLAAHFDTREVLERCAKQPRQPQSGAELLKKLHRDLQELLPGDFLIRYPEERIKQLPRYLRGLAVRADRGMLHVEKALAKTREIEFYHDQWQQLLTAEKKLAVAAHQAAIDELFWMIEEYKISLFAQELRTLMPISPKRLDEKLLSLWSYLSF